MIDVLLIDDSQEDCESIKNLATFHNIEVSYYHNLKEGLDDLFNNPKYKGLILDARCLVDKDQETESDDFLFVALGRLKEWEKNTKQSISTVINTGYMNDYEKFQRVFEEQKIPIYTKGDNSDDLFEGLLERIQNADKYQIELKYQDVFEIFKKGYLPNQQYSNLLELLLNSENASEARIQTNLVLVRKIQEAIYQKLNSVGVIPDNCFSTDKNTVKCRNISKHLTGNPSHNNGWNFTPRHDFHSTHFFLSDSIYGIACSDGVHPSYDTTKPTPSIYTVVAVTNGLLELLLWFKKVMNNQSIPT